MAARAKKGEPALAELERSVANHEWSPLETWLVRKMAEGLTRKELIYRLTRVWSKHYGSTYADKSARRFFRETTETRWFLDELWRLTKRKTEGDAPRIMKAMVREATRGNVNAAKLSLDVTGQHSPQSEQAPASVNIVFGGMPRPVPIEAEVAEEAEWEPGK